MEGLTTAECRPARFHEGKYWEARLPLSDASTMRGSETSFVECRPRVSVTALHSVEIRVRYPRLLSNNQLVELQRPIFVISPVSQHSCETFFDELLCNIAERQQR